MESITVHVTHAHIQKGKICDSMLCPLSHALRERMPGKRVTVGSALVSIDGVLYLLGNDGAAFVRAFDGRKTVEPCSITLNAV